MMSRLHLIPQTMDFHQDHLNYQVSKVIFAGWPCGHYNQNPSYQPNMFQNMFCTFGTFISSILFILNTLFWNTWNVWDSSGPWTFSNPLPAAGKLCFLPWVLREQSPMLQHGLLNLQFSARVAPEDMSNIHTFWSRNIQNRLNCSNMTSKSVSSIQCLKKEQT